MLTVLADQGITNSPNVHMDVLTPSLLLLPTTNPPWIELSAEVRHLQILLFFTPLSPSLLRASQTKSIIHIVKNKINMSLYIVK